MFWPPGGCRHVHGGAGVSHLAIRFAGARSADHLQRGGGHDILGKLVQDRTGELAAANDQLRAQIAEKEAAAHALLMERNLLRTLIDAVPDPIYAKNLQGKYILSNVVHAHRVGQPVPDRVIGVVPRSSFRRDWLKSWIAMMRRSSAWELQCSMASTRSWTATATPAGLRTKVPLRDPSGKIVGMVGISRDITYRKEAESRLSALNATLEQRAARRSAAAEQRAEALTRSRSAADADLRTAAGADEHGGWRGRRGQGRACHSE